MLVLSRKVGEKIRIGDDVTIVLVDIRGIKARIGIEAPDDVRIVRDDAIETEPRERNKEGK